MLPKTIIGKFKEAIAGFEKVELSVDINKYINACLNYPQLFYTNSKTIIENIRGLVSEFEKEGVCIDLQKYFDECLKQSTLFVQLPTTVKNNVMAVVKEFHEELDLNKYINICLKYSKLFYLSPKTIIEHINAYKYVLKQNQNNKTPTMDQIFERDLLQSTCSIYLNSIVKPQITKQLAELADIKRSRIKTRVKGYFAKYPTAQFVIKVPQGEMQENFIKVMQEYSIKDLNRADAFIYEL